MGDFETLYHEYGKTVYCFLLSLTRNEHLAEELTQETLFRAIMNVGSFREDCKISVWLCQIAKNLYYEHQKKTKRNISLEDTSDQFVSGVNIEKVFEDKETANRILLHLHDLEEPYKEVFMLHALGDVSLKQISELFGKSDSWARVTYYRAKNMIIEKLKGESK